MHSRFGFILLLAMLHPALLHAQQPLTPALLILNKRDRSLAIVNPTTRQVVARVPAGEDPHEVVASSDGKFAYISNYGGPGSNLNTLSVVDLVAQKALPAINLGALHSAHGLAFAGGKVYFTAETNKVIGRYDPATQQVDWVLGLGQNRTHMIVVSKDTTKLFTSNVNSDTISIIEHIKQTGGPFGGPPGGAPFGPPPNGAPFGPPPNGPGGRMDWDVTAVHVGQGPEGFDVAPDEKEIWAANSHDGSLSIIDVATKQVTQTLDAHINFANRLKFSPDGKLVLISSLGSGEVVIFDAATRHEIKRLKLGRGAAGILMEPGGARAYVACSPDNTVAVVDLKTLEVTGHIDSGQEPDGLAWVE
ncbi:MAG: YncE family protein [Abitibacteriaceae bacterium]|nr:YncE family protein [Abditibacteriaceae bacterium]